MFGEERKVGLGEVKIEKTSVDKNGTDRKLLTKAWCGKNGDSWTRFLAVHGKVDKVFTVGCFDLFHHGHVNLMNKCRSLGKQVIVGVHDSRSCYRMKNKVPIDSTERRMLKVKEHADVVYCITSLNAANHFKCIVHLERGETALFVRGDDAPNFPYRDIVEDIMPVLFVPTTPGISSTMLRAKMLSELRKEDGGHLSDTTLG